MDENPNQRKRRLNRENCQSLKLKHSQETLLEIGKETKKKEIRKVNATKEQVAQRRAAHTFSKRLSMLLKSPLETQERRAVHSSFQMKSVTSQTPQKAEESLAVQASIQMKRMLTQTPKEPDERLAELAGIKIIARALSRELRKSQYIEKLEERKTVSTLSQMPAQNEVKLAAQASSQKMKWSQTQKRAAIGHLEQASSQIMIETEDPEQAQLSRTDTFKSQTIIVSDSSEEDEVKQYVHSSTKRKKTMQTLETAAQVEVKLAAQDLSRKTILFQIQEQAQIELSAPALSEIIIEDAQLSRTDSFRSQTIIVTDSSEEAEVEQFARASTRKKKQMQSPAEAEVKLASQHLSRKMILFQIQEQAQIELSAPASSEIIIEDAQLSRTDSFRSQTIIVTDSSEEAEVKQSPRASNRRKKTRQTMQTLAQAEVQLAAQDLSRKMKLFQTQEQAGIRKLEQVSSQIMIETEDSEQTQLSRNASIRSQTLIITDSSEEAEIKQSVRASTKRKKTRHTTKTPAQAEVQLAAQALSRKMRLFQTQEQANIELASSQMMIVAENPKEAKLSRTARFLSQSMSVYDSPEDVQALFLKISMNEASEKSTDDLLDKERIKLQTQAQAEVKLAAQALSLKMRLSQNQEAEGKRRAFSETTNPAKTRCSGGLYKRSTVKSQTTKPEIRDTESNFVDGEHYQHFCGTMDHIQNLWIKLEPLNPLEILEQ